MQGTKVGEAEKDDPAQVARQGFEGLMKGEASVFGGSLTSRGTDRLPALTPDSGSAKFTRPMAEPGSAEG